MIISLITMHCSFITRYVALKIFWHPWQNHFQLGTLGTFLPCSVPLCHASQGSIPTIFICYASWKCGYASSVNLSQIDDAHSLSPFICINILCAFTRDRCHLGACPLCLNHLHLHQADKQHPLIYLRSTVNHLAYVTLPHHICGPMKSDYATCLLLASPHYVTASHLQNAGM